MRFNKKVIFLVILSLCLLVFGWEPLDCLSNELSQHPLSGTILIHIINKHCYDFSYSTPDNLLVKKYEGDRFIEKRDDGDYIVCRGSSYTDISKHVTGFQFLNKAQFKSIFGEYDLSDLKKLIRDKKDCDPQKKSQLKKIQFGNSKGIFPYEFRLNEQRTYAVYTSSAYESGLLIDLGTMEASMAFCNDELQDVVWNKNGEYIAYFTPYRRNASRQKIAQNLVVRDIRTNARILEKPLERWGEYIAWSPSSEYIAVLSNSYRVGLWPWELVSAAAGHPIPHDSFFLSVYTLTGKELFNQKVIGNVVFGTGSIIWVEQ